MLYTKDFQEKIRNAENPYGDGDASDKIVSFLSNEFLPNNTKKEFYDL